MLKQLLALIAMFVSCVGCETSEVWNNAGYPQCHVADIAAIADTPTGRALVVRYGDYTPYESWLLIPLDGTGHPVPPFAYDGPLKECGQILRGLSPTQRAAVCSYPIQPTDGNQAPGRKATVQPDPDYVKYFSDAFDHATVANLENYGSDVVLGGYRLEGNNLIAVSPVSSSVPTRQQNFPPGTTIVLLPYDRDRPTAAIVRSKRRAVLLTPLTVAYDAVDIALLPLLPILIPIWWLGGGH